MKITVTITPGRAEFAVKHGKGTFTEYEFRQAYPELSDSVKDLHEAAQMLSVDLESFRPKNLKVLSPESPEIVAIYKAYPRKVGRPVALKAIIRAIQRIKKDDPGIDAINWLADKTREYAQYVEAVEIEEQFIPHPATYYNQERYSDQPSKQEEVSHQLFR